MRIKNLETSRKREVALLLVARKTQNLQNSQKRAHLRPEAKTAKRLEISGWPWAKTTVEMFHISEMPKACKFVGAQNPRDTLWQNVWRAFRGALCKGLMTDIDMKNCHPVILLWLCEKFWIDCPKLREYVTAREHHLAELGNVLRGKDREHCKRLFLIATNTNKKIENVPYPFFNEYQAEIQDVIQPALMDIDELSARFKPHAEQAAGQREADGREANEEGSFLNLALCYSENIFLQEARAFLDSVEIETAVLMLDGLMVYGDHYEHRGLLLVLHNRLKAKFGIEMHFDFKQHEMTVLDDMPEDFDETVVLGDEWHTRHTKDDKSWSTGILFYMT